MSVGKEVRLFLLLFSQLCKWILLSCIVPMPKFPTSIMCGATMPYSFKRLIGTIIRPLARSHFFLSFLLHSLHPILFSLTFLHLLYFIFHSFLIQTSYLTLQVLSFFHSAIFSLSTWPGANLIVHSLIYSEILIYLNRIEDATHAYHSVALRSSRALSSDGSNWGR